SGGGDRNLKLWDALTGQQLRAVPAHAGPVYGLAFSPDGRRLATSGTDRTVKVWDAGSGPRGKAAPPTPAPGEAPLGDPAGPAPARAYRSLWALAGSPAQSVPFLRKHLRPAAGLRPEQRERLPRLLRALDDRRFNVRERAAAELAGMGAAAAPDL